ncbi:MAG: hypothetical protein B7Z44_20450, partial [Caulobacter sp. 12-67-6]
MMAVAILLLSGLALAAVNERAYRNNRTRETGVQADILAASVTAALAFDDRKAAQGYIDALSVNPQLQSATIYDLRGRVFASFSRGGEAAAPPPPSASPASTRWIRGGRLQIVRPVSENGTVLGRVFLSTVPEPLQVTFARHGGASLLVVMSLLFMALLGRAYRALDRRAAELARVNEDLRRAALERERAEEALLQAQKMEALGQLTGGIAHDFNNLLTGIVGSLDLMQTRLSQGRTDNVARYINAAMTSANRAAALTHRLLA